MKKLVLSAAAALALLGGVVVTSDTAGAAPTRADAVSGINAPTTIDVRRYVRHHREYRRHHRGPVRGYGLRRRHHG